MPHNADTERGVTGFDRNWAGPEHLKPKIYRTQSEKDTWHAIVVDDEYRCPQFGPDDVVIDIGAHIGSFCYKAYLNGSRSVHGFELMRDHYLAALRNLEDERDGILVFLVAVVRSDGYRARQYFDNGAWNAFGVTGNPVDSISLDELLSPHESVRFLKIDCEGGEWPILYTSTQLGKVEEIAGEYHLSNEITQSTAAELQNLPYRISLDGLEQCLLHKGYSVEIVEKGPTIGNFFAKKNAAGPVGFPVVSKNWMIESIEPKASKRLRMIADELEREGL